LGVVYVNVCKVKIRLFVVSAKIRTKSEVKWP